LNCLQLDQSLPQLFWHLSTHWQQAAWGCHDVIQIYLQLPTDVKNVRYRLAFRNSIACGTQWLLALPLLMWLCASRSEWNCWPRRTTSRCTWDSPAKVHTDIMIGTAFPCP